jgi:hypothetical protein
MKSRTTSCGFRYMTVLKAPGALILTMSPAILPETRSLDAFDPSTSSSGAAFNV